jgi:DNA polymerase-3 subunit alpha (Gram-positive type)
MIADLLRDKEFNELEKEYKFLSRARGDGLEKLEFVIFDCETTGLEPDQAELTEIGAFKVLKNEVSSIFSSLIKTKNPIPPEITQLTGIDDTMVKDFPPAKEIIQKFLEFIGDSILIAHNADFDMAFLRHHAKQLLNVEIKNDVICTVKLARFLLPQLPNHKLHTVGEHFKLKTDNRHRAIGDVELTYMIWQKFVPLLKAKNINTKHDLDSLSARL